MQVEARTQWCQNNDDDNDGLLMVRLEKGVPKVRGIANRGVEICYRESGETKMGKCNELRRERRKKERGQNNNPNLLPISPYHYHPAFPP